MITWDQKTSAQFKITQIAALGMLVVAPMAFLIVANLLKVQKHEGGEYQMLFYMLLIMAIVQPALARVIEKGQISSYRKRAKTAMSPMGLFTNTSIIKMAMVEAIYIYGLVVFILSGDMMNMLYFYPFGIVWSLIYWPRKSSFEKFIENIEMKEPFVGTKGL